MALCLRLNRLPDELRQMRLEDYRHLLAAAKLFNIETEG